ncbi:hypothetical protein EMIT07CA2_50408 [Brevibacillus sp. IT-7CA2]
MFNYREHRQGTYDMLRYLRKIYEGSFGLSQHSGGKEKAQFSSTLTRQQG